MIRKMCPREWLVLWAVGLLMIAAGSGLRAQEKTAPEKTAQAEQAGTAGNSSPEALNVYTDAANFQNNSAFDLAADEWARFLERFADDPLAPKAQHYLGVCQMQLKQYAKAAESFQRVIAKYPQFEQLEDTYLNLGWCRYSMATAGDAAQYPLAAETFNKLAADYPKGKYVEQALFFEAESLYASGKRQEAALAYGRLVTGYVESKLRSDALYALGVTLEEMGDWVQANKAYDMFLADYAKSELLTEVRMRRAETILQQGDVEQAEQLFADVASVEGFDAADHALMRQAFCAARLNKMADAGALYAAVAERFPQSKDASEAALSAGRCYYRAENYDEAAKWLSQVVSAGGEPAAEAAHWLCRIHLRAKRPDLVLSLADSVMSQAGTSPFAANLRLDKADALYEMEGHRADALAEYLAIAQAYPDQDVAALALYNAAFAALDLKQHDQALDLADQFLQRFASHVLAPDARYIVAECQIQKKDYAAAESLYRTLIEQTPEHPEKGLWQVRRGLVAYLQKNYQAVIDLLTPIVAQLTSPDQKAESLYLIGLSHYQLGQFSEAAAQLQAATSTSAEWRQADETLLYLARAQHKIGQIPQALATLEALLKSYPATALADQVSYHLGEYRYAIDQYPEAIAAYDEVIHKFPQSTFVPFALYGKGWASLKSGQYEPAAASFTTLIDHYAEHQLRNDALLARGMCHRQQQKFAEAIADLDQYLAANPQAPQRADALYERGLAEASLGEYAKSAATLTSLLTEQPDYPGGDKVLYELGWAHRSQRDEAAAVQAFATLVQKYPASPLAAEANFHVGEDCYAKKQYADAAAAYQQAAQANNLALAEKVHYKLGWAYYQLQQYPQSLEQFEAQLQNHPDGPLASDASFMKGECLFRMKDYQKALPALVEAMGRPASSPQIAVLRQMHAGQAALQLEKYPESIAFFDVVIQEFPESNYLAEAHFERGRAQQKLNQLEQATADFKQAAERSRDVVGARAQFMVGEIGFQKKQYEEAIKDFQRVMFGYGADQASPEVKNWQAKAGYEAGRCSEVLIQQSAASASERAMRVADAKKFYRYVVETHPENEMAAQAKKQLDVLAQL
ncbi:MAG: tetratricopeptide repeat protein [Pirellulaceae bacterium]